MKRRSDLLLFVDAAEELGVHRNTVADLCKALGIKPKPTGMPGRSKGLDAADMRLLKRALSVRSREKAIA